MYSYWNETVLTGDYFLGFLILLSCAFRFSRSSLEPLIVIPLESPQNTMEGGVVLDHQFLRLRYSVFLASGHVLGDVRNLGPDHQAASITGVTFIGFVNRERVQQAAVLLRHTNMQIQHIVVAAGYNNTGYFTRQFVRNWDCTPKEYRAKGVP